MSSASRSNRPLASAAGATASGDDAVASQAILAELLFSPPLFSPPAARSSIASPSASATTSPTVNPPNECVAFPPASALGAIASRFVSATTAGARIAASRIAARIARIAGRGSPVGGVETAPEASPPERIDAQSTVTTAASVAGSSRSRRTTRSAVADAPLPGGPQRMNPPPRGAPRGARKTPARWRNASEAAAAE